MKGCIVLVYFAIMMTIGSIATNYMLESILGKTIGFFAAGFASLFIGGITVPGAIVCWILRLCGIDAPFVH